MLSSEQRGDPLCRVNQNVANRSFQSMDIKKESKKVRDGKSYLPKGVDGVGQSTKKFLELGPEQMLPQADRRELEDNRLVMKVGQARALAGENYSV